MRHSSDAVPLSDSPYRHVVVQTNWREYAVEDRLIEDGLTRVDARYMVWKLNGGTGSVPRYLKSASQRIRDLTDVKRRVTLGEHCAVCRSKEPPSPWHVYRDVSQR